MNRKLLIFYAVSTTVLLVLSSVFLYAMLNLNLRRQDFTFLADEAQELRGILRENPQDLKALEQEMNWEGNVHKPLKYYVRVLDARSNVVTETRGIETVGTPGTIPYPKPIEVTRYPDTGVRWKSPNSNTYLLMSMWAQLGDTGPTRWLLQMASDVTDSETLSARYRRQLFGVLLIGILVATVTGAWITRKGLGPLREITGTLQRISAAQLHERISPKKWPEELASLADEFDKMLDRLEESFNRLSQFSADLAHELRTPINNLMGETEVTLARTRSAEDYREVLQSNLEEFSRLSRMIESLLFLARAENPETVIDKRPLNAGREIRIVADYYETIARETGVTIRCRDDAPLCADPNLFRRALGNLLANAIEASPPNGTIEISVEPGDAGTVMVTLRDQGAGITPEHLPKIFDRFYQADSSRSKSPKGMGFGLAMVQSIMKLHGGSVSIESVPSEGTSVTLRFPAV